MKQPRFVKPLLQTAICILIGCHGHTAFAQPSTPVAPIAEVKPGSAIPIRYKLAKPGKVSINIYDGKGAILRELLSVAPRNAGDNMEVWDGLDSKRQPLPPGKYSWKLLATPGLKAEYLLSVGSNYAIRPNANWNSLAPGSIGGPSYVYADATGMYIGAASENIEPALIKQSLDGKTRFWERGLGPYNAPRGQAQIGGVLWLFVGGLKSILPLDPATGGDTKDVNAIATSWTAENGESAGDSMAGLDGLLAVAYTKHNAIRWIDPATSKVTATTSVVNPIVLASGNGVLYASDGTKIFQIAKESPQPTELITGLKSARTMTVDAATGDLLVFDGEQYGGGIAQIKRFSKDGKFLRAYGREGGRRHGLYTREEQESFFVVAGLTSMPDGGFAVAEDAAAPRRVAVFNKDGKFQREWYGGQMWAPWIFPEPDNPNAVWMGSDWNGFSRLLVDAKTKTWKVHSTYYYGSPLTHGVMGIGTGMQGAAVRNGVLYLNRNGAVFKVDRDAGTWKIASLVTGDLRHEINIHFGEVPPAIQDAVNNTRTKKFNGENFALSSLLYTDTNNDGKPQPSEMTWQVFKGGYHDNVRGPFLGWWIDKNDDYELQADELKNEPANFLPANLFMDGKLNFYSPYVPNRQLHILAPTGWSATGAPIYGGMSQVLPMTGMPESLVKDIGQNFMTRDEKTGDFYMAANAPAGWGASSVSSMVKLGSDGSFKWSAGSVGNNPGQIRNFRGIFGVVKDCVAASNTSYEWPSEYLRTTYVWDKDGLYVGGLLDNPVVNDSIPQWRYALGAESIFGKVWEDPKTGEVLFFGHWLNEGRIYKITGWDHWERQSGVLDLKDAVGTGGNGVLASFNKADGTRVGQWTMAQIDFDPNAELKSQTAKQLVGSGQYLVRFNGRIAVPSDGKYSFSTRGAGTTRLLIDGRVVLDSSIKPEDNKVALNPIEMKAGEQRDIQLEYSPPAGQAGGVKLLWNMEGGEPTAVPQSALFATPAELWSVVPYSHGIGLRGKFWGNYERKGEPSATRVENMDVNFRRDGNRGNTNAASWTGFVEARRTGYHRFRTEGAGSTMEVSGSGYTFIYMEVGKRYSVTLFFSDANIHPSHNGLQGARLDWIEPDNRDWKTVPQSQLYPAPQ